jgi:error-prone DNA polymerase
MVRDGRDLEFVELHGRSAFSFLTGASGPEAVVRRVAELGGGAVAVVDAGGFYGSARAHQAGVEAGGGRSWGVSCSGGDGSRFPVLCATREGYRGLCRQVTTRHLEPERREEWLARAGDWIVLTGDRDGAGFTLDAHGSPPCCPPDPQGTSVSE